jgi:hypothetical protein
MVSTNLGLSRLTVSEANLTDVSTLPTTFELTGLTEVQDKVQTCIIEVVSNGLNSFTEAMEVSVTSTCLSI